VTVKKWYKLNDKAAGGRWEIERYGKDSVYAMMEGETQGYRLWLNGEEFRSLFREVEMDVEMTAEELKGEREAMRGE